MNSSISFSSSRNFRYTSTPERSRSKAGSDFEQPDRQELLQDLRRNISTDENSAELLLQAFDLQPNDSPVDLLSVDMSDLDVLVSEAADEENSDFLSLTSTPPSQNPFLSTPLRTKHFPRLSPSILRNLLRSPSIRAPSPSLDVSFASFNSSPTKFPPEILVTSPDAEKIYPLTPPARDRIPLQPIFNSPLLLPRANSDLSCDLSSNRAPPAHKKIPNHLVNDNRVCSMAIKHFHLVIDEMRGVGQSEALPGLSLLSPPPSIPSPRREQLTTKAPSRRPGPLEKEFATLLSRKAEREGADAKQLRTMADRLDRLARRRKALASFITTDQ